MSDMTARTHASHTGWKIVSTDVVDCGSAIRIGIVLVDRHGRRFSTEHAVFRFDLEAVKESGDV